ncbi:MAG: 3-phosphoshikimate 1-carboxyvinyltransferase [Planctomycetota bacterium]|jgi:3-phosphoshikimate 1-carboxyvinyltransferase
METVVEKAEKVRGTVHVPGDKSVAHRALILGALAKGKQTVEGLPPSEDVKSTAACLRTLGCRIEESSDHVVEVTPPEEWVQDQTLDAGNSGTSARLLAGLVAGAGINCLIDGDDSLRKRPMKRIAEPLRQMGAKVETSKAGGLPMRIEAGGLKGITYKSPVASAQLKSAVLLAGLFASKETTVIEPAQSRDHTERMLEAMGVGVERDGLAVTVPGGATPDAIHVPVPGDLSSALFFIAAAAIIPGSEVLLPGVGINPTRTGALAVLERMGAMIALEDVRGAAGEPIADIRVISHDLKGVEIAGDIIPRLIDELPVLAVVATRSEGETCVRDAQELRFKESDRIDAVVQNLSRLGADIEAKEDGFIIRGPCPLKGTGTDSFGDHRIAMAMAVAGLAADGKTAINNSETVAISYPNFFDDLRKVCR